MLNPSKSLVTVALAALSFFSLAPQKAEAYQVDCAILLCLAGGWPASAECSHARAVFIRRITPFPVEPPLQIWRCPMGAAYTVDPSELTANRIYEILHDDTTQPLQSFPSTPLAATHLSPQPAVLRHSGGDADRLPEETMLQLVNGAATGADIDIGGKEFDFVRSIRVFHVRYATQAEGDKNGCERWAVVQRGTYGRQGDFRWVGASPADLPAAHNGMEGYGENCPHIWHRSVFVDWRDYEGNYGFEQVNY